MLKKHLENTADKDLKSEKESLQTVSSALQGLSSGISSTQNMPLEDVPLKGVDLPFAMPNYCGDFPIRILSDGTWLYRNSPIGRKNLCRLFASVLHRDMQGDYWLVTPAERGRIAVDIAPFTFVACRDADDWLEFRSNLDEWVRLDEAHPLEVSSKDDAPLPLLTLRGRLQGLLVRPLFYQLVEIAKMRTHPDGQCELYLSSGGIDFSLGVFDPD